MPANLRSLQLTNSYRDRLLATRTRLQTQAERTWPTIEALDSTDWADRMATAVTQAQAEAVRATSGYLTAFLSSELGRRVMGPTIQSHSYAGISPDGRSLTEALQSPLIGVRARLADGSSASEALRYGLDRATRQVGVDFDHAHRTALLEAIDTDERFEGWNRALRGTCGACAGVAAGLSQGLRFQVHPGCQCVSEPAVRGAPNAFPRPTGTEIFVAKSEQEQDEMLGPDAAARVRSGEITLADLIAESHLDSDQPDFITQKPLSAVSA